MLDYTINGHTLSLCFGYISLTFFVFVYGPQIYYNYKRKSVEGLSISFPLLWLLGDFFSITGALLNKLAFTVILIGFLYGMIDVILLSQFLIYPEEGDKSSNDETSPLLKPVIDSDEPRESVLTIPDYQSCSNSARASTSTLAIFGGILWLSNYHESSTFSGLVRVVSSLEEPVSEYRQFANICGYLSILLFMFARVPQMIKNRRLKSVEGLSASMFICAILGNFCYAISIVCESQEWEYLERSLPWLGGAFGLIFMDILILFQFLQYRRHKSSGEIV